MTEEAQPVAMVIRAIETPDPATPTDFESVFSSCLRQHVDVDDPLTGRVVQRLKATYEEFQAAGGVNLQDVALVCQHKELGVHGNVIVYESVQAFQLTSAVELVGHHFFTSGNLEESYRSYKLAIDYFSGHRSNYFPKIRELRMKLAQTIFQLIKSKTDTLQPSQVAGNGNGSRLVGAINTLAHTYLRRHTFIHFDSNMTALFTSTRDYDRIMHQFPGLQQKIEEFFMIINEEILCVGMLKFGVPLRDQIGLAVDSQFYENNCPREYADFCINLAILLNENCPESGFRSMFKLALRINRRLHIPEVLLLIAAVGSSFSWDTPLYKNSFELVEVFHRVLLEVISSLNPNTPLDLRIQRYLEATTSILSIWTNKMLAIPILMHTNRIAKTHVASDSPFLKVCREAIQESKGSPK